MAAAEDQKIIYNEDEYVNFKANSTQASLSGTTEDDSSNGQNQKILSAHSKSVPRVRSETPIFPTIPV